jgi:glycine C-acetyltransferase
MKYRTLQTHLSTVLNTIRADGLYKNERIITSPQSSVISTTKHPHLLNFCSNNYLGLCNDPRIVEAARQAISDRGFGINGSRFVCGTSEYHKLLEKEISEFYETEDTVLFASCFDANETIFETLLDERDAIISDRLNHASIINGIRLCKASRHLYEFNSMEDLEKKLMEANNARFKLIVTDGVFSMDGEISKVSKICDLADRYGAIVMVDECHGTGVVGGKGRGAVELENALHRVEIVNSTLGKALGGAIGGFTTGKKEIVEVLRQKAKNYLHSNNLTVHAVQAYRIAINTLKENPEPLLKLNRNVRLFRQEMKRLGFNVLGHPSTAICPVLLKDARVTAEFADAMLDEGIYVIGFSYPVVPKGLARIRVQLSASHSEQEVLECVRAFEKIGKQKGAIQA